MFAMYTWCHIIIRMRRPSNMGKGVVKEGALLDGRGLRILTVFAPPRDGRGQHLSFYEVSKL